jgi:hypothetical protein
MTFRRRKSGIAKVADALGTSSRFKSVAKAAKRARKTVQQVARRTPIVKRLPYVAGAGVAAFAASRVLRTTPS